MRLPLPYAPRPPSTPQRETHVRQRPQGQDPLLAFLKTPAPRLVGPPPLALPATAQVAELQDWGLLDPLGRCEWTVGDVA